MMPPSTKKAGRGTGVFGCRAAWHDDIRRDKEAAHWLLVAVAKDNYTAEQACGILV